MINPEKLDFKHLIVTIGNLPSSYIESLSYYECLLWLCNYLENTVIPAVNTNGEAVEELQGLFIQLQQYVDNYFENLNVQEEINEKLEQMAQDGELTSLISSYVDPIYRNFENDINRQVEQFETETTSTINSQNNRITAVEREVTSVVSGTPTPVSSVASMTDTTKTYLLTTDGYWYYYNGTGWVQGGVYQATSIQDNEIAHDLVNLSTYSVTDIFKLIKNHSMNGYLAEYAATNMNNRICTNRVHFKAGDKIKNNSNGTIYILMSLCDKNGENNASINWFNTDYTFASDTYVYLTFKYGSAGTTVWTDELIKELDESISFEKENSVNIIPEPKPIIPENLITDDYTNVIFENAVIDADGSVRSSGERLLSKLYYKFDTQKNYIVNTDTSSLKYSLHYFNKNNEKTGGSDWITTKTFTIPECAYFRIQLGKPDDTSMNPTDDGDLYELLSFRPTTPNIEMRTIANDFTVEYGRAYGTSYVLTRIPKTSSTGKAIRPKVAITTDDGTLTDLSTVKNPREYASFNNTLFNCNAGIFNPTTKEPLGQIIINGVSIQDKTAVRPVEGTPYSDGEVYPLCIDANGNMSAPYDKTVSTATMIAAGVKYAIVGWIKLIDDYVICNDDITAEVIHKTERLPQQIIGQYQNGDYFVFTSDGVRGSVRNERGLLYSEIAEILAGKGVKFAYALDGGASTTTMLERRKLTPYYDGRTVTTVITFE